ncbi:MAG: tetratricopeptide repeat protein [Planctomycetaceae bacterium]|nr:tetratricopeptide repeat protein [Planctomycetaceae bacterium]
MEAPNPDALGEGAGSRETQVFDVPPGFDPSGALAAPQVDELVAAWRRGERPRAEEILARHPGLGDEAAIRLIVEEFVLRLEAGMDVDPAEVARRFPLWRDELELLLDSYRMMQAGPAPDLLPGTGEDLAGFRLLAELGRGASGGVFLAQQPELADRLVVVKITPRGREEHLSLAPLQHRNIVPLYSAQVIPDLDLQILCMPFLGGASLAQVLDLLRDQPPARRAGRQLLDALDRVQARLPVAPPSRGPFRPYLARATYVEAICWIGACLADGLQYAHDRNLVHMDIKPSNVLLAGDGQPMLLDFHLAREPIDPGAPTPSWMGGTPGYMAPEHSEALIAVGEGRAIPAAVDGRADLFALGMLLDEALCGRSPEANGCPRTPLHRRNPVVSVGLSDVIQKCLQPDPRARYPDAAALAADLRRHLEDLPLRGVPNRSPAERWRKWRRRRPHALPRVRILLAAALTTAAATLLLWDAYRLRVHEIGAALASGRAYRGRHHYQEAAEALRHGLALAGNLPAIGSYRRALGDELALALRDGRAADLHRLVDLIRFRYGIDPPPPEEARTLTRRGRALWKARSELLAPGVGRREPEVERGIRADLLDFALVWADLRVRSAPAAEADDARREALRVLEEAEDLLGPSPAIDRERRTHAGPLGRAGSSPTPSALPKSAWEHYDLGRSYLRSGQIAPAAEQFQLGLERRPEDFWLNFYQGLCAYRLGQYQDAVQAFCACVALSPRAECFYNRALAHEALGRTDRALRDYTRALRRDPALTEAALNRGRLSYHEGRLDAAAADLRHALTTASSRGVLGIIHYNLALVDLARGDRPAALSNLKAASNFGYEPSGASGTSRSSP